MSLLHDLINESAAGATGAGAIAGGRARLFGGPEVDQDKENLRKTTMMRRIGWKILDQPTNQKSVNANLRWREIAESAFEDEFDTSDVLSKLDAAEKKSKVNNDTVCFGMEDETGAIVKVYVRDEQAEDFEHALATMLGGADEDANDENSSGEIAEVLYQLKDKFEIVDVDWGVIEGDEEEEQELEGGEEGAVGGEEGMDGEEGAVGGEEGMDDQNDPGEANAGGGEEVQTALQSVIDVLKADSEARQAEAEAKKAEAEAKIGKHAAAAAEAKVQQEEEILDMETYEKNQKAAEKEAKTLAKLAKYRHEVRGNGGVDDVDVDVDADVDLNVEENEEMQGSSGVDDEISKEDLADLIYKHLRANQN